MFSGGRERVHWEQMVYGLRQFCIYVKIMNKHAVAMMDNMIRFFLFTLK